jgi:hypothetical protein
MTLTVALRCPAPPRPCHYFLEWRSVHAPDPPGLRGAPASVATSCDKPRASQASYAPFLPWRPGLSQTGPLLLSNPHAHQAFPVLSHNSLAQKFLNNRHMRLKMLRHRHRQKLPSSRERHRQQQLIRQMPPDYRLRNEIIPRGIHSPLRHALRRDSLLPKPRKHLGDVLVFHCQGQRIPRSKLPRQSANMQILRRPVQHLLFFVGRAVRAPALARHGELEA